MLIILAKQKKHQYIYYIGMQIMNVYIAWTIEGPAVIRITICVNCKDFWLDKYSKDF